MHLPDGFLSPPVWATLDVASAGAVVAAARRVEATGEERQVPLMGVTAAFIFAAQMLNFPIGGGTSGHLLGAALATALLGPWRALVVMTTVLVVQALVFADGGLLALGANVFNMGVLGCGVSAVVLGTFGRRSVRPAGEAAAETAALQRGGRRPARPAGIALAAWLTVVLAAAATAVELAWSGTVPLGVVLPAMVAVHALIGVGEALITMAAVAFVGEVRPEGREGEGRGNWEIRKLGNWEIRKLGNGAELPSCRVAEVRNFRHFGRLGLALLLAAALVPLASSLPDGLERVAERLGIEEQAVSEPIRSPLRDYQAPSLRSPILGGYLAAGVGVLLVFGLLYGVGAFAEANPATSHLGFLDRYSDLDSPLHRLDARAKLLGLLLFIVAVVLTPGGHWLRHGLQATALATLLFVSGVPMGFFLRRVLLLSPFFLLASVGLLLGGSTSLFLSVVAKSALAVLAVVLLTATTPFPQLLCGLRSLRVPGVLIHVLSFAYRYLLLLADEGMRLSRAYAARAVGPRDLRQARPLGRLIGHFFVRTYDRSERIYQAMLARGFDGQFRTLSPPRWGQADTGWLLGFAVVLHLLWFL